MNLIAIYGASGFIGKNLRLYCSERGYEVKSLSIRNVISENDLPYYTNVIINLVGKAHDHKGEATKEDYYYANVKLAKDIFQAFLDSSATLLIHVSSLAALEEFESSIPLNESDPCRPVSWYGKSKRDAEEWLLTQALPPNKKLIIIRPPMVHGAGDKGNLGLLYKFISKGIPYPLESFDNRRSFISIDNFSFFIRQIIDNRDNIDSGIYHIADDEPISTKEIIQVIKKMTGKNVPDIALPQFLIKGLARVGDVVSFPLNSKRLKKMTSDLLVSNKKIKQALGINKLPITAKEGLEKTIRSFHSAG